ncbi:phosphate--nucleotide phosphotransferase [Arthrobacter sp. MYb211]|uniref:PPK2 family polyphosphate kinase n=1 Tax=unclassified Arthrobacter TaxID=235627 RepID=UPI000CFD4ED7|nr:MULTISPECIES: PPK2 family polyphosphate kinase [unclassified Arthrobacter]PRA09847.1 phosphate--nucleotide phosphotransferase [Arthrobacter sp. MYb221]PRC04854.1 phosphate--nucleotide phosphotransferase [Arthrobacter sp. MYb211]
MSEYPQNLLARLRVVGEVDLSQRATGEPDWWPKDAPRSKRKAAKRLEAIAAELTELQERLFASALHGQLRDSLLLVLQGMDTAGKGGIVRHVMGLFDPQGVDHHAFKAPTDEEQAHDFLWRVQQRLPEPGIIGVFDRSHYEDVLIHRVQKLSSTQQIEARYPKIVDFEHALHERGIHLHKVMLHIGPAEQYARLSERLDREDKHWKYSPADVEDRLLFAEYQRAYELAIERTATVDAPWYVIPADQKWRARLCVAELLLHTLREIDPLWPKADFDVAAERKRLDATK